jgi:2-dehydropantoate 2-reductase
VATLLARAGERVIVVATPPTVATIREHGLRLKSERYGDGVVEVEAQESWDGTLDACIVAVKATALDGALDRVPALPDGTLLVPLLNGVDHVGWLRERCPRAVVAAATIKVESSRPEPGVVHHDSAFAAVQLAAVGPAAAAVQALADRLRAAGLDVDVCDDEAAVLWRKLSFLGPLALATTAWSAPAGVVRIEHRAEIARLADEVAVVSSAEGVAVDGTTILAWLDDVPASMRSSMQRDADAGLPTEVDAIGGALLRGAERHGIDVPVTRELVARVLARST